jgi:hypothetical protein
MWVMVSRRSLHRSTRMEGRKRLEFRALAEFLHHPGHARADWF